MQFNQRTLNAVLLAAVMLVSSKVAFSNPMEEWQDWVLEEHQQQDCPWIMAKENNRACIWPGELSLVVGEKGGTFNYGVDVYKKNVFISLPGNTIHWPTKVMVNGENAPIIERNSLPHIALGKGSHKIEGKFDWDKRPGKLTIPRDVALVTLTLNGKNRAVDRRNGQLIFSGKSDTAQVKASDSLGIEVFRQLKDGVPLILSTHITLSVSGKPREVSFGKVMLAGTQLLHLQSKLPARIEPDGTMRAQVTPGEHLIQVHSRFANSPSTITAKALTKEWPEFEYISFKSATSVRQAKLSGPVSIDTSQISIPAGWEEYPTYRMADGETLTFTTEFRGDHSPAANELHLQRDLWLDFGGEGITALDRISGEMNKDWRLNAAAGVSIGRARVDGEPVLITQNEGMEGIEVRSPTIQLEAVTRTEVTSGFSASGWSARADQYTASLHLPPGWRVLHASGVDSIRGTWLSLWDLWDVFLVLIIISATRKLIGNAVAILAGAAFLFALHEPGAPLLIIPVLLVVLALLPVLSGTLKNLVRGVGVVFGVVLVLSLISFAVDTFRLAIYPSLERAALGTYGQSALSSYAIEESSPQKNQVNDMRTMAYTKLPKGKSMHLDEVVVTAQKRVESLYQVTENDRVQTGPGLPTWTWNEVNFRSSGPVPADQTLSIYYSNPMVTSIWRVLSVFLVALYVGIVISRLARLIQVKGTGNSVASAAITALGVSLVLLTALSSSPPVMAEDYPPKHLLDKLEERLTKAPDCLPSCASLNDGRIVVSGSDVSIRFGVYADADIALPLPSGHSSWTVMSVSENQQLLPLRKQQDALFVRIVKGHHALVIKGKLTGSEATVSFPLAIHNMAVEAPDWVIEGLVDGRVRGGTLTLRAKDKNTKQEAADSLKAEPAPAFVRVVRHFIFGKKWTVQTTVERFAPRQGVISVPVALIPGEKLLQDMGRVKDGKIIVQLGHRQAARSWVSSLEPSAQLQLEASGGSNYIEQWEFTPSSLWRLQYQGIPPVKSDVSANAFEPVFKPWPSEELLVTVSKPEGVPGDIHTVERIQLEVDTGTKLQRSLLTLDIQSSLGADYTVAVPENSEVLKFSVDQQAMNIPSANLVKIPLQPGSQTVEIEFQSLTEIGIVSRSPAVLLPDGATNVAIQYSLPRDRWPLYVSGPAIGPAMLYWGVLCVIVLGAIALPRIARATDLEMPIGIVSWLLLGLGLSTVNSYGVLIIAVMFFLLAVRKQLVKPETMTSFSFNLLQCAIVVWVGGAVLCMIAAIPMGLLSNPEMSVVGNGSSSHFYNYYQDIAGVQEDFPAVTVVSVPILAYRIVMLLWSLWLSMQLIRWAGWAWACFTEQATWKSKVVTKKEIESGSGSGSGSDPDPATHSE